MLIDELVEKSLEQPKKNPWTDLCSIDFDLEHAKVVEIIPSRTLKINPSLSAKQEE